MPSKVIFETEDQVMDEVVDTKTLKVSRVGRVAVDRRSNARSQSTSCPGCLMFDNMWLKVLTSASRLDFR